MLEINEGNAVSIKQVELAIVNRGWDEGWVAAAVGRRGGPAAASRSSARGRPGSPAPSSSRGRGEHVVVYERDEAAGGLVRFGVPEFKIEKRLVERRVQQLAAEGVEFRFGVDVGSDVTAGELRERHDAVVVATGSRVPRDLPVPGRELDGVHFAMEYLYDRARSIAGSAAGGLSAAGKHVVVIGGGDTGADCVAHAQSRRSGVGHPDRAARRAAAVTSRRRDALAEVADEAAHVVCAEGGRRAVVRDLDDPVHRRRRPRRGDPLAGELGRPAVRARCRHRGVASGRARSARDGLPRARARICSISCRWSAMRAAMPRRRAISPLRTASSQPATRGAASR